MEGNFYNSENERISKERVIEVLDSAEIGNQDALDLFAKYSDQCHRDADTEAASRPGDALASDRANITAEIKIAKVLIESKWYKSNGIESLEDTLLAAEQTEENTDLVEEILVLINSAS